MALFIIMIHFLCLQSFVAHICQFNSSIMAPRDRVLSYIVRRRTNTIILSRKRSNKRYPSLDNVARFYQLVTADHNMNIYVVLESIWSCTLLWLFMRCPHYRVIKTMCTKIEHWTHLQIGILMLSSITRKRLKAICLKRWEVLKPELNVLLSNRRIAYVFKLVFQGVFILHFMEFFLLISLFSYYWLHYGESIRWLHGT